MKKVILIIEDNFEIRDNLVEILELAGYDTLQAADGKIGVEMAIEHLPDLILCDIMMPKLDGYGVLHILSRNSSLINTPFLFLTAKTDNADLRKGMTLGADDYITKPFDETDLLEAIENRLHKYDRLKHTEVHVNTNKTIDEIFKDRMSKSYNKKEIIFREGDTANYVYRLLTGKLKLIRLSNDGKEMVLELVKPNDFFGYWSVLQDKCYEETAEVLDDATVELIPAVTFKYTIEKESSIANVFIKLLSSNLLAKEYKIVELAYNSVRKRVAAALIELSDKYRTDLDQPFSISVSRETLAGIAGTTIESAIRMLSDFKASNLISINKAEITILDYEKLKNTPF